MPTIPRTHKNNSLSTVAVAALVGGLTGATVGLMFSTKSGNALTEGLKQQQGTELAEKLKRLAEDLQTFIQDSQLTKATGFIALNLTKDTQPQGSPPQG